MFPVHSLPRSLRRALAEWIGRLADRLTGLKEQVQDAVVEAVGRTTADAAEAALRRLFGIGLPRPIALPTWSDADDPDPDAWDEPPPGIDPPSAPTPAPPARRPAPGWSWRPVLVAALHAVAWWLRRHAAGPVVAAAAVVFGATVCLLD
jgi:hypothetical protein